MSLTRITTVHCDRVGCGNWEHTQNDQGAEAVRAAARDRKRRGWTTVGKGRDRRDFCPRCRVPDNAEPEDHDTDCPENPGLDNEE